MRIGMLCHPGLAGCGIVGVELGHELAARGHEVHFVTSDKPFRLRDGEKGVLFLASVFDEESADQLDPHVEAFKIASYEMTHIPLIRLLQTKASR